jgi:urease accessory protein
MLFGVPRPVAPGHASLSLRRVGLRTVVAQAVAASPVRLLTPRNHGDGAWVYLASLGGGLVDGDHVRVQVDAAEGTTCLLGTQASTKVYRSPNGCSQRLDARVAAGAALAIVPDPVVCFAGARYEQEVSAALEADASLFLLDGYSCGRAARGERWQFARYRSLTTVTRGGDRAIVDSTLLDAAQGSVAERMGRFEVVLTVIAVGPRFSIVREAVRGIPPHAGGHAPVFAVSSREPDVTIARVAAECFEDASRALRPSFDALARVLGDDPFARKW